MFAGEGIGVRTGADAATVAQEGNQITVTLADGETLTAERLLVATGRRADLGLVGVGAVGVDESQRWIPVDAHQRVTDGVWAVGDICGRGAFTHVAMYQSAIAVADILGHDHVPADYRALPRVTFADTDHRVLVGATAMGPNGGDVLGLLTLAVDARVPLDTLRGMIYAYPTFHRGIEDALRDLTARTTLPHRLIRSRLGSPTPTATRSGSPTLLPTPWW